MKSSVFLRWVTFLIACAGLSVSAQSNYTTPYTITTVAGSGAYVGYGSTDGAGNAARFYEPSGVVVDGAGNTYVADYRNNTIRKIAADGVVTTLAGSAGRDGVVDGTGDAARFRFLSGLALDGEGNLYAADSGTIRKISSGGVVTTLAGLAGSSGSTDGMGSAARFSQIKGLAVDSSGDLYVADSGNSTIRRVTRTGSVTTLAGKTGVRGSLDGTGTSAQFTNPWGVAVDGAGNIYVADVRTVRKVTTGGIVTTLAGSDGSSGSSDGSGSAAAFTFLSSIAVDRAGNLYAADRNDYTIRKITGAGEVITLAGEAYRSGSVDGVGRAALFNRPEGVAVDVAGNVYVADTGNHSIRRISVDGVVTTTAGSASTFGLTDGTGRAARFSEPQGMARDSAGNVYIADTGNHSIRKIGADGVVTTLAGLAGGSGSSDGTGGNARFSGPTGVAVDRAGAIYVADRGNGTIRKISGAGVVTTLAGTAGVYGAADGSGGAAKFRSPSGVAVDLAGNIYVADTSNHTIRKITSAGLVTTLAGAPASQGSLDGTAGVARFFSPQGVAVDDAGTVYVADTGNHLIRKIASDGTVTTLAGGGLTYGSTDGTGSAARFYFPAGIAVDGSGTVFVGDTGDPNFMSSGNNCIRQITSAGVVTTLAGKPGSSGLADGTGSGALFFQPTGVTVDAAGVIYIADRGNHLIRRGAPARPVLTGTAVASAPLGRNFSYQISALGAPTNYGASGLPAGLNVDPATGLITGTPTEAGLYTVALSATNSGGTGTATLTLSVGSVATVTLSELNPTYDGRAKSPVVTTVPPGLAVHLTYDGSTTAPTRVGSYAIVAIASSAAFTGSATGTLTIGKASQTITFGPLGDLTFNGEQTPVPSATASSSLPVSFSVVGGPAYMSPVPLAVGGYRIIPTAPGTVTIRASQFGSDNYNPAPPVERSFIVRSGSTYDAPYAFTTLAGYNYLSADGVGGAARFNAPTGVAEDAAGNIYVADYANHTIRKVTATGVVTIFAGTAGKSGSADGTGTAARFNRPAGVAVDRAGNIFVADYSSHTIRKITREGVVSTLAGAAGSSGSADGTGTAARFRSPTGVAVDGAGKVYVADQDNHTIRSISVAGVVTTLAGMAGSSGATDGLGNAARFNKPTGVAVDGAGNVYATDFASHTVRKITSEGGVTTLAGSAGSSGSTDGLGTTARFSGPTGVAVDAAGSVYVAEYFNHTIRKITNGGAVGTVAGLAGSSGATDETGSAARFNTPYGVAVDSEGRIYVADNSNNLIRKITSGGLVTTLAGALERGGLIDAPGRAARFGASTGVAVDSAGNVFVADRENHVIRKIAATGSVTTWAGAAGARGYTDGAGGTARFNQPAGLAADEAGNLYVADTGNSVIRKITAGGSVTTLAGSAGNTGAIDGTGSIARFNQPAGVAVDAAGNLFVADQYNHTIRRITSSGVVTTLAGRPGTIGSAGGTGGAARFYFPTGVAVDAVGNVYVADRDNHSIRKVTNSGVVATLAGRSSVFTDLSAIYLSSYYTYYTGSVDATGSEARFNSPTGIAVDSQGNVYVAEQNNQTVRRITATGVVTTLAGLAGEIGSTDGIGDAVRFAAPTGLAVDGAGKLYVADRDNFAIRIGALAPPTVVSALAANVTVGQTFNYTVRFSGAPTSVSVSGLPAGLIFNSSAGSISGVPTVAGTFSVLVRATNGAGTGTATLTLTITPATPVGRLVNLSVLTALAEVGDSFSLGYVVSGASATTPKALVIRAVGPSLGALGVAGTLEDPKLELFAGATKTAENDNWSGAVVIADAMAAVGAFPFSGPTSRDAAFAANIQTRDNSVKVSAGAASPSGVGTVIAELYDATPAGSFTPTTPRLVNVSVIKNIGTGLTAGFVIGGGSGKTVLIRAVGPGLAAFGVAGTVVDPRLELFDGASKSIGLNDNWGGTTALMAAFTAVGAFELSPASKDAALLVTLQPGNYSVLVSGVGGSGTALVEVYEVP